MAAYCDCYHPCQWACCRECHVCTTCKAKWDAHAGVAMAWVPMEKRQEFVKYLTDNRSYLLLYEMDPLAAVRQFYNQRCR